MRENALQMQASLGTGSNSKHSRKGKESVAGSESIKFSQIDLGSMHKTAVDQQA